MNEENPETSPLDAPASGNRWEPGSDEAAYDEPPVSAEAPATPATAVSGRDRFGFLRTARTGIAAGLAAALIAVGFGGFAIGRATADHHDDGERVRTVGFEQGPQFTDREGDGDGPDGHHGYRFPPPPAGVPGQVPGQLPEELQEESDNGAQGSAT